jgi:20S proteasome alpha/beta subunit
MECTLALVGDGYTLVAADRNAARSIICFKKDEDKVKLLDSHKLVGSSGAQADTVCFTEYVQKNMALYEITNGIKLSTPAAASFVRNELAVALRKGPYQTNLLLGGFDESTGASLYYLDYLASSNKVNYGCHGHVSSFVLSIFDREWKPNMSEAEGLQLLKQCIDEIQLRFLVHMPVFTVKIVDKDGVRVLEQPK